MAFKNLEDRFNQSVDKLYAGAKHKFENGRPSTGRNDDPLIVRKPGDGYWSAVEGRATPISSAFTDVKRMTLFTASVRGLKFLAKQQILQTGNTFESTRIINPAFHISNAVPFIHTKRMVDIPITKSGIARTLLGNNALTKKVFGSGEQRKDIKSLRKIAQLQEETYNKATEAINVKSLIKKIPVIGKTISAVKAKRSVGDGVKSYKHARPELSKMGLKGLLTTLTSAETNASSGYIMANQVITHLKTADKYSTNFDVKYYPFLSLLGGTYTTYTNLSDDESSWVVGQQLNHYTNLRKKVVSKTGTERIDFVGDNLIVRLSPRAKKSRLAITYGKSDDKKLIDGNIKLDKYVDYGSTNRYSRPKSDPGKPEKKPTIPDKVKKNKTLGSKIYPKSNEEKNLDTEIKDYVKGNAKESEELSALPRATVRTSGNEPIPNQAVKGVSYIKYFTYGAGTIKQANEQQIFEGKGTNARDVASGTKFLTGGKRISYIKDTSNNKEAYVKNNFISKEAYSRIENRFDDPIVVSFAMGVDGHVRFRAYLKDLQQNTSPKYNPLQYIGRMEQFIYYTGVQREVSFKLGLVAFSKDELEGMWRRINYLTGMAYPYGFNKGIFQPNIVRMTIGDVYTDQPCYITSLNTNFTELTETWELDSGKQVPISAQLSMNFTLIEKASRLADSPFYGITENTDGFSKEIPTAAKNVTTPRTTAPSTNTPTEVSVKNRDLAGFDVVDRNLTNGIIEAAKRGDNQTVSDIGAFQANRREEYRKTLGGGG